MPVALLRERGNRRKRSAPPAMIESPVPATVTALLPNVTPSCPMMEMPLKLDETVPAANPLTPVDFTSSMPDALLIEMAPPNEN